MYLLWKSHSEKHGGNAGTIARRGKGITFTAGGRKKEVCLAEGERKGE